MTHRPFRILFAGPLVMAAVMWACGSSDDNGAGSPDGGSDRVTPPQDSTIVEAAGPDRAAPDGARDTGGNDATSLDSASDGAGDGAADGSDGAGFDAGPPLFEPPRQLAAGGQHTCAIGDGGVVRCWGSNANGQLGAGLDGGSTPVPVDVVGIQGALEVTAGYAHTCARLSDGTARCWGNAALLGDDAGTESATPVVVNGLGNVTQIVAGYYHTCALRADQHVLCWGANGGRIGDGTPTDRLLPTEPVGNISDAVAVGAGWGHTCIVHAGGGVTCSGEYNAWGQIGDGTTTDRLSPVAVLNVSSAVFVALGAYHSCAVLQGSSVMCWGNNQTGQIGIGTEDQGAHTATPVPGIANVAQIEGGGFGECAVTTAQVPYCWGDPTKGVMPVNDSPTVVPGLGATLELAGGDAHVCARLASGQIACWGDNSSGQLGSADAGASSATPVIVQGL